MLFRRSAKETLCSFGIGNLTGTVGVAEDQGVSFARAFDARDAVQRVTPVEDLERTWLRIQPVDNGVIAGKDRAYCCDVLVVLRPNSWAVFELSACFGFLGQQ